MNLRLLLALAVLPSAFGQDPPPDYGALLQKHQGLGRDDFYRKYAPERRYADKLDLDLSKVEYLDLIQKRRRGTQPLEARELEALQRQGFVVVGRWSYPSFGHAFYDVYSNDQPLFVTTDSILHAFHKSFDEMLLRLEQKRLIPLLAEILKKSRAGAAQVGTEFAKDGVIRSATEDADFMLAVAECLLSGAKSGDPRVRGALECAAGEKLWKGEFLGTPREVDFSQFKPRGHYTKSEELQRYFRAMMWLGREDLSFRISTSFREAVAAFTMAEAMERGGAMPLFDEFDRAIRFLIGDPDGANPRDMAKLLRECGHAGFKEFAAKHEPARILEEIRRGKTGDQKILSAVFRKGPNDAPFPPPKTMQLMGQRFTVDSFVFHNVTFDRIPDNVKRMMPSPLDAAFALGNVRAADHLRPEIEKWNYQAPLAACADYVRSLPDGFWSETVYHGWLRTLQDLGADTTADPYPPVMRTRAWADLKLQTHLASWAQLRHDTILYVKQSYTMGCDCNYRDVYVEPYPTVYGRLEELAKRAATLSKEFAPHFERFARTMATLRAVSEKELKGEALDKRERDFLEDVVQIHHGSGTTDYTGWYPQLFLDPEQCMKWNPTVADVHTQPTDEAGNPVGRVLHVGVGNVHSAVVIVGNRAYLAPVFSYYETVTRNFERLNDEEWKSRVGEPGVNPTLPATTPAKGPKPERPAWARSLVAP